MVEREREKPDTTQAGTANRGERGPRKVEVRGKHCISRLCTSRHLFLPLPFSQPHVSGRVFALPRSPCAVYRTHPSNCCCQLCRTVSLHGTRRCIHTHRENEKNARASDMLQLHRRRRRRKRSRGERERERNAKMEGGLDHTARRGAWPHTRSL